MDDGSAEIRRQRRVHALHVIWHLKISISLVNLFGVSDLTCEIYRRNTTNVIKSREIQQMTPL